jgi:hypothetical protein
MNDKRYRGSWHPCGYGWSFYVDDREAGDLVLNRDGTWTPRIAESRAAQ